MIRVGIIGAAGYTAGELMRLLVHHPAATIVYAQSGSQAGKPVHHLHQDLLGDIDLAFQSEHHFDVDLLFLCSGHGKGQVFMQENAVPEELPVIDLGNDFRLNSPPFVYGLPEVYRERYTHRIANPGCFASAIQLAVAPMAKNQWLDQRVQVNAITGSTGAGQRPSPTTHFSWRSNNISVYKAFSHQHVPEVEQCIAQYQEKVPPVHFIPVRGDFTRGIFAMVQTTTSQSEAEIVDAFREFYRDAAFVHVSDEPIHLKQVVNTNKCLIHIQKHDDQLLVTSALDNLLKGASGAAIQNMNILFNLPENTGLRLKAAAF